MNFQNLCSGKHKKNISKCRLLIFFPACSALMLFTCLSFKYYFQYLGKAVVCNGHLKKKKDLPRTFEQRYLVYLVQIVNLFFLVLNTLSKQVKLKN